MKFSILVPVYNVEHYLTKCLDSIVNQTHRGSYEIILVDDGSTDSSGRICDEYAGKYPDKIRTIHKKNEGLISARRVGIENASSDYCLFVDSDDYVAPNLLEVVENTIRRTNADIVLYSFFYDIDGKFKKAKKSINHNEVWTEKNKKSLYEKLITTNDVTAIWNKAIKTDILKSDPTNYKKYYDKNMGEDSLQSLYPLTAAQKVVFVDEPLYYYRVLSDSMSHDYNPNAVYKMNMLHVYAKTLEYLPQWDMDDSKTKQKLCQAYFNNVMYLFFKCYENCKGRDAQKKVLQTDWDSLMPTDVSQYVSSYGNIPYAAVYKQWRAGNYGKIRRYFARRKAYKVLRNIKSKLK